MPTDKRVFDLFTIAWMSVILLPVMAALLPVAWLAHGRPLFIASERMRAPGCAFRMYKLRSMTVSASQDGITGGDKAAQITGFGWFLRRTRLDELPQLLNIARGEMSIVGPRPPLRRFVDMFPDLYAQVLRSPPGVTGLASLVFAAHEERLLAACRNAAETDTVYIRRCIPRKARIDMIYLNNRSLGLDFWLALISGLRALRVLRRRGRLPRRRARQPLRNAPVRE